MNYSDFNKFGTCGFNERHTENSKASIGIIIIGRNEGERLRRAFSCLPVGSVFPLYVDSGSTDGSVELAKSMDIPVHSLDASTPFSAARARLEGANILMAKHPDMEFIQFLDGDCTL